MKQNTKNNPYATNKGGKIVSRNNVKKGEPTATKTVGGDLRVRKERQGK